ncbi:hypothetical protein CSUB01_02727 [Colletotrichum sublineola]|uniref:Uncharacterized protein n=1 Tax=Colletotrichum sublineola TaxID=1173701 RepID=A0A066X8Z7_COLSU|nr:hypothetical protein CSUB01_02727 [Colletotrichum sublineola]
MLLAIDRSDEGFVTSHERMSSLTNGQADDISSLEPLEVIARRVSLENCGFPPPNGILGALSPEIKFSIGKAHGSRDLEIGASFADDITQPPASAIFASDVVGSPTALLALLAVVVDGHRPLILRLFIGEEVAGEQV